MPSVRARFVRRFLQPDAELLDGASYRPERLIAADGFMADLLPLARRCGYNKEARL